MRSKRTATSARRDSHKSTRRQLRAWRRVKPLRGSFASLRPSG